MMLPQSPCEECDWENAVLRKRCRNCSADLVQHPERAIDIEVRLDVAQARAYERSVGICPHPRLG